MNKNPFFVTDDHIRATVPIEICRGHLRANTAVIINQVGNKSRIALTVSAQLEPEHHGGRIGFLVTRWAMCPKTFAGQDVL